MRSFFPSSSSFFSFSFWCVWKRRGTREKGTEENGRRRRKAKGSSTPRLFPLPLFERRRGRKSQHNDILPSAIKVEITRKDFTFLVAPSLFPRPHSSLVGLSVERRRGRENESSSEGERRREGGVLALAQGDTPTMHTPKERTRRRRRREAGTKEKGGSQPSVAEEGKEGKAIRPPPPCRLSLPTLGPLFFCSYLFCRASSLCLAALSRSFSVLLPPPSGQSRSAGPFLPSSQIRSLQ